MNTFLTPQNVTFVVGLLGILFTIYNYFRNPQIAVERREALLSQKLEDIQAQITAFTSGFQAHIQSDVASFGGLNQHIVEVDKSVVRLTTIIEERIPKSKGK